MAKTKPHKRIGRTRSQIASTTIDRRGPMYPHPSGRSKATAIYHLPKFGRKRL